MNRLGLSRRDFLSISGALAGSAALHGRSIFGQSHSPLPHADSPAAYTLKIATTPVELAPKRIVSITTYNGQFPGSLLRLREGERVTIDLHNETDTPEQVHLHGQFVSPDVDGAAEEGTPFVPPHGRRRISFIPEPSGFRFYHTHVRAGADLSAGQYSGLVGPIYIEPKQHPGDYDREVFLTMKEFQPKLSRGGDMAMDFLFGQPIPALKEAGESKMKASQAKGMPHDMKWATIRSQLMDVC
jgi:FtsP/CotA-like multicopper oxidase with cupredoxin domain